MGCNMSTWIISVCGIALMTVLCDVIIPDGGTKKYVRTVIGIVISFAILLPLTKITFDVSADNFKNTNSMAVQQQFLDGVEDQKQFARLQKVNAVLQDANFNGATVTIEQNGYIKVTVNCDETTLLAMQNLLAGIDEKMLIVWRNING